MATSNHGTRARPLLAIGLGATMAIGASGLVGACGGEPERTIGGYCDAVRDRLEAIMNPSIATGADIDATIDAYRSIADVAPAAVEPEWQRVIEVFETAATLVPGDQASLEIANRAALAGQPAYTRLQQYTQLQCTVAIGTPPPPTNPVTATTAVPPPTVDTQVSTAPSAAVPPSTLGG